MVPVEWGAKSFTVKKNKIHTPNGIELSESISTEEVEVSGKKSTVKVKGLGLMSISMSVILDCRFVNVADEINWWKDRLRKKASNFMILGKQSIGKMYLTSYKVHDLIIGNDKEFIKATIDLSFTEDGAYTNKKAEKAATTTTAKKTTTTTTTAAKATTTTKTSTTTTAKVATVKSSATTTKKIPKKGSTIKPKSGVRWYLTAEGALKKSGKSGKAYNKNLTVTHTYSKNGKIVCVNPQGLGWLKVEDVTLVKY